MNPVSEAPYCETQMEIRSIQTCLNNEPSVKISSDRAILYYYFAKVYRVQPVLQKVPTVGFYNPRNLVVFSNFLSTVLWEQQDQQHNAASNFKLFLDASSLFYLRGLRVCPSVASVRWSIITSFFRIYPNDGNRSKMMRSWPWLTSRHHRPTHINDLGHL